MTRTSLASLLAVLGAGPLAAHAQSHDARAFVSTGGIDFLAKQVPSYIPTHLTLPPVSKSVACTNATQRNTVVDLSIDDFALSIPQTGRLHLEATISVTGSGELYVEPCVSNFTCAESASIAGAHAVMDLDVELVDGKPQVSVASATLQLDPQAVDLTFSGCLVGDIANWVIDFAKDDLVKLLASKIEDIAKTQIAPKLEEILGGTLGFKGAIGAEQIRALLSDLTIRADGIDLGASIDVFTRYPAAACIADHDPGEPVDLPGVAPDLATGPTAHLAVAANLGILNDAIYHAWRRGFACFDQDYLAALGFALPTDLITTLLPGFPPGTKLEIQVVMQKPPRVMGVAAADASITLSIEDLKVDLIGHLPDGTDHTMTVMVSAEATAAVGIDPATNALLGNLRAFKLDKLEFDQLSVKKYGFDADRLKDVVENYVVPGLMAQFGDMPLTGPVFAAAGYAIILRGLDTSPAYLAVKTDLFRIPTDDTDAPDTALTSYPIDVVSPKEAIVQYAGSDAQIPLELLRYQVSVDGVAKPSTFVREVKVGEPGKTATYQVAVAAIDLGLNQDPTPATIAVKVDGITPSITLHGDAIRTQSGPIHLEWSATDDLTAPNLLGDRIDVFEVTDPTDELAVVMLDQRKLPPGATTADLADLPPDHLYRLEIHVVDGVGNDASSTVLIDLRSPSGCSAAGPAGGGVGTLVLGVALLIVRRRRRR